VVVTIINIKNIAQIKVFWIHSQVFIAIFLRLILTLLQETPATSDPLMNLATSEIKARLVENYRRSVYAKSAKSRIRELASIVSKLFSAPTISRILISVY